tara:strand:- start:85 stop:369 length:285 start_codon:yes stop_codon:yes gene_type:complete
MLKKIVVCFFVMGALAGTAFSSENTLVPGEFNPADGHGKTLWSPVVIPESRGGLSKPEWAIRQMAIKPTQYYYHPVDGSFWKKRLAEPFLLSED